jgi:hypothetical protein
MPDRFLNSPAIFALTLPGERSDKSRMWTVEKTGVVKGHWGSISENRLGGEVKIVHNLAAGVLYKYAVER